jgi:hypothetical protein
MPVDMNVWHRQLHEITGSMALKFNQAASKDLRAWATILRRTANAMDTVAAVAEVDDERDAA